MRWCMIYKLLGMLMLIRNYRGKVQTLIGIGAKSKYHLKKKKKCALKFSMNVMNLKKKKDS